MTPSEVRAQIDPEKYYSASKLIAARVFPWIRSASTFNRILDSVEGQKVYKPIIRQMGFYVSRKMKGTSILEVIKLEEEGKLITK